MSEDKPKPSLWEIAKSISIFLITIMICVKAFTTPLSLTIDAPTLISLLLALFSIWLSALFYFKATETSNTFYDNTYKFTRDIAQLLAKIESGFGERLRNLDEGYNAMRNHLQPAARSSQNDEVEKTKQKLDEEKEDLKKTVEARNKIVRDLLERSQLQTGDKERIAAQLKEKESELEKAQQEVAKLNRKLMMDRVRSKRDTAASTPEGEAMNSFTMSHVVKKIGKEKVLVSPLSTIKNAFQELVKRLPSAYLEDLAQHGYYEKGLTSDGALYIRRLAARDAT